MCTTYSSAESERGLTEESEHEDAIIPYSQLVGVFKVIPGHEVVLLDGKRRDRKRLGPRRNFPADAALSLFLRRAARGGDVPRLSRRPAGWSLPLCFSRLRRRRAEWWQRCRTGGWGNVLRLPCIQRKLWGREQRKY